MFDIGFFELLVIAVVGLLVIGPERLPETIRTVLLAVGRIKRGLTETRQELERQIGADDIRRQLHNEDIMARLEQTQQGIRQEIDSTLQASGKVSGEAPSGLMGNSSDAAEPAASSVDSTSVDSTPAETSSANTTPDSAGEAKSS